MNAESDGKYPRAPGKQLVSDFYIEMDLDVGKKAAHSKSASRGRIQKKQSRRKSSIAFPRYKKSATSKKSTIRI